jgi:hypothetical protein
VFCQLEFLPMTSQVDPADSAVGDPSDCGKLGPVKSNMNSFRLIAHSCRLFWKHPALLLPLFLFWLFYAPAVIYLKYFFPWQSYEAGVCLEVAFSFVLADAIAIVVCCAWLLEMLQEFETGGNLRCFKSLGKTIAKDLFQVLPVAIVWAVILFVLTVIEVLLSKEKQESDTDFSDRSVVQSLSGAGNFSLTQTFFQALQKGIRMVVFLIIPAIVWEGLDTVAAMKKGIAIFRAHLEEFAFGYALTYAAGAMVFIPVAIFLELSRHRHGQPPLVVFSHEAWCGLIVYIGFATSFCLYLEQMFGASLYLWHMKWEKTSQEAIQRGDPAPLFKKVPPPCLLETFSELREFLPVFGMEDDLGRTNLHLAAASGDIVTVERLLSKGADINARDADGQTPLDHAVRNGHLDIIRLFMSAGAVGAPGQHDAMDNDFLPAPAGEAADIDLAAARNGNGEAMLRVARRYKTGTATIPPDLRQYLKWIQQAVDADNCNAMVELGSMYERGDGVPRDPASAAELYLAAQSSSGMLGLIRLYRNGDGPKAEARRVFNTFLHALEKQFADPVATYGLGVMYQTGQGVPKDPIDAENCFKRAASLGFNVDKIAC